MCTNAAVQFNATCVRAGLMNGDLFSKIIAFSPGGAFAPATSGHPPVFISGGTLDPIFPIDQSAVLAACELVAAGYTVAYVQFNGGHDVPQDVTSRSMGWFLGREQVGGPPTGKCSS